MTLERALAASVRRKLRSSTPAPARPAENRPEHLLLGEKGEWLAAEYLTSRGYLIIGNNVRYNWGEIDIIAQNDDEIIFVEVRTRTVGKLLPADRSVGPDKLRKLVRAARTWVEGRKYDGFWRVDLIAITVSPSGEVEIEHITNITDGI